MLDESFLVDASLESGRRASDNQVLLHFNKLGADRLKRMTSANIGRYIAMAVNNEVLLAPRVEDAIMDGAMMFTASGRHEAQLVYLLAKYGPLPAPVTVSRLSFAVEPPPSPFQPVWLLCWALIFALVFFLIRFIGKASGNISRASRQ
jgi:preprotein translocase subunit SecD